jgi:RNA polymerase sigma-70 factor (ECF subfamily)
MWQLDRSLIAGVVRKDPHAFAQFYEMTVQTFYRYLTSHYYLTKAQRDDLLSDYYLKLWQVVDKYDPTYKFTTFVWVVFKNLVKDYFKKSKEGILDEEEYGERASWEPALVDLLEHDYQFSQIQHALQSLDVDAQEVIFLKYIEDLSYEEITALLGGSQEALRQRLSRALKKLKEALWQK